MRLRKELIFARSTRMCQCTYPTLTRSRIASLARPRTPATGTRLGGQDRSLLLRLACNDGDSQVQIPGLRVHGFGVLDGFLVGPDFNWCSDRNEFVNLFDLRVCDGYASRRPVDLPMQLSDPGIFRFEA